MLTTAVTLATPARADVSPGLPPVQQRSASTVTADSLPTAQIGNGVVWTQLIAGDTVYAGGEFSTARPPGAAAGTSEVSRNNLLAYSLSTGQLLPFNPSMNSKVYALALSPDKKRLYVGGAFTTVGGVWRSRIAAFDTATGALISSFAPEVGYNVKSIVATNDTVYVGGLFTSVAGNQRMHLAAFQASDGALLTWAPSTDLNVQAMSLTPDGSKLVLAGNFSTINGIRATGLGAVDARTGAVVPWKANQTLSNTGDTAGFLSMRTDGTYMYSTGWTYGPGDLEGTVAMNPADGSIAWIEDCHGDTYDVFPASSGTVYTVSHAHYCTNIGGYFESSPWDTNQRRALAFTREPTGTVAHDAVANQYTDFYGLPAPSMVNWFPTLDVGTFTGQTQAAWTVTGNDDYVVMGGEFQRVNLKGQQGLARFATKPAAPAKRPPSFSAGSFVPTLRGLTAGSVRVAFQANSDTDDLNLTYRIVRDGDTAHPVATFTAASTFWNRPSLGWTDTGLTPGSTHTYRISATDGDGNTASGDTASITLPASAPTSAYARQVQDDGASLYWRFGEPSGTAVLDWAGVRDGLASSGMTRGAPGAISGDTDAAGRFGGTSTGLVASQAAVEAPQNFSVEAWVKTKTTRGGRIVGFGNRASGASTRADRFLSMDGSGRITLGMFPGSVKTVTTTGAYNDGGWHHLVGTVGADGMRLYVDGVQRGQLSAVVGGESYQGYWRVGGDTLSGWPNRPASDYLQGDIDDVAVYPKVMTAPLVANHYNLGRSGTPAPNLPPTAAFTSSADYLAASFDASGSSDPDGSIASYAWDFGDGAAAGSGVSPQHTYAAAGSYPVKLTVTDNDGATTVLTRTVTVEKRPNTLPTASFISAEQGLTSSFDAAGSSDPDGSIASYAWDFGDGTAAGSGVSPQHTYAQGGTYPVKLTVTDNDGGTATVTRSVTVVALVTFAKDEFGRTVTGGLGSADTGGTWTLSGGASLFGVDGSVGTVRMSGPGATAKAYLGSVSRQDQDITLDVSLDKVPVGANAYTSVVARRIGTSDYRAKVLWRPDGQVSLYLSRTVSGTETTLRNLTVPGLTFAAGQAATVRLQVSGTAPTTVQAKVWKAGTSEPTAWTATATDTTTELAGPGGLGVETYLGSTSTNAPIVASLDHLLARNPQP
ncbi:PKD domain-containing protein [Luteipulveratus sp. YIM 133132]|uniref:PKD domain-containing protein n=1 Tax=Luteipulveratus flavus TaxID=3031728 RepID=UPI0023AF877C|nr:PKD domain-containing protein [Luteipulveratus sp. YIM 133132]MDE9364319.1 PKD domain-containing protein [Luteipulveratus sp. YIM 133132]